MAQEIAKFTIAFESDTKDFQKDIQKAEKTAEKSTQNISKTAQSNLKITQTAFQNLTAQVKSFAVAFASFAALKSAFSSYTQFTGDLINSNALLGLNTQQLSAMGRAMTRFGGDLNSVTSALKSMNSNMQEAKFGGGALVEVAKKYGIVISPYQKADKALLNLAKSIKNLSLQTKTAIMGQLGLDEAMQRALIDGGAELERLVQKQKLLGVETEEDIKNAKEFQYAWADLKDLFAGIAREMMKGILPILKGIVKAMTWFVDIVRNNKVFITAFFVGLLIALTPILAILAKMAIASITAFAPFYAIGAVITAIALIFEDIYYYFMGWDSVTGDLVKKFPILAKILKPIRPIVMGIVAGFKKIWEFIKDPSWNRFKDIFTTLGSSAREVIDMIMNGFGKFFDYLAEKFPILAKILKPIRPIVMGIVAGFKKIWEFIKDPSWNRFKDIFTTLGSSAREVIDMIMNGFGKFFDYLAEKFPALAPIFDGMKKQFFALVNLVKELWQAVKNFFSALFEWNFDGMIQAVKDAIKAIMNVFSETWNNIKNMGSGLLDKITPDFLKSDKGKGDLTQIPVQPTLTPSVVNNGGANNNVTINNNVNNAITTNATTSQIAGATEKALINSVSSQRQLVGGY